MTIDRDIHFDFKPLVDFTVKELFEELADTHTVLANLHVDVAFLRGEESRGVQHAKPERIEREALVAALTEKKWLIVKLIENLS